MMKTIKRSTRLLISVFHEFRFFLVINKRYNFRKKIEPKYQTYYA